MVIMLEQDPLAPIRLSGGMALPRLGLGTWPLGNADAEVAVALAIELGYRLIDTAFDYGNEKGVGRGIRRGLATTGLAREDIIITTKFNAEWHGIAEAHEAFECAARRLKVDYIDVFLIHWPNPWLGRYVDAWRGLIRLREQGLVRAIGGSNFLPAHIDRLRAETGVEMEINQIQISPYSGRRDQRLYHEQHGIVTQAWSPLALGRELLTEPLLREIAQQTGRTPAQGVLRWHIQSNISAIPKSSDASHLRENASIFDFVLSADQMSAIGTLERGTKGLRHPEIYGH